MRILSVEDDSATAQAIELMLVSEGMKVQSTPEGEEGMSLGKLYDYDCILLDLGLPDVGGFEVLRQLRIAKCRSPIIIVSGNAKIETKVRALNGGADDYVTKPFHKDELIARIHAVTRRYNGFATNFIETGDLVVNLDSKTVTAHGSPIHLTGKEYQMLELLSLRKGMTLSKDNFINHLYGGRDEPESKIIDVYICKLRKKLRAASADYVETVWGRGYTLRDPNAVIVGKSPSLAPEIRDMADNPPVHVSKYTPQQRESVETKKRFGKSPPLAPV